jgi:hypothetical protein
VTPERRYHLAMARMLLERGRTVLAEAHLLATRDCDPGCRCDGCHRTRKDRMGKRWTGD